MSVQKTISNDYQPICDDCGIALCWELSEIEYKEHQDFWDEWKCRECNPNYLREYSRISGVTASPDSR